MEGQYSLFNTNEQTDELVEKELTLSQKVEESRRILRLACDMSFTYYGQPLILGYSAGKDSDVLLHLAETTLKPNEFEVINSHTSVDYPESVYHRNEVFLRLQDKGVKATVIYPKDKDGNHITMWNLILARDNFPTRLVRFCCKVLKETSTPNRMAAMGIRAAESNNRKGRDVFAVRGEKKSEALYYSYDHVEEVHKESQEINDPNWDCTFIKTMKEHKDTIVNPIYTWTDKDVWDYLRANNVKVNPLYECGLTRIGCILCPMASYRLKQWQIAHYPTYKQAYIHAYDKLLENWKARGKQTNWKNGEEMFQWWIEENKHNVKGQMSLFDDTDTDVN